MSNNNVGLYFEYKHLPEHLQAVSKPFSELVDLLSLIEYEDEDEFLFGMRKLLEAKDCFVRSAVRRGD